MTKEEFSRDKDHWISKIQRDIAYQLLRYMEEQYTNMYEINKITGLSFYSIGKILDGDSDYKISTLIEVCIAINKVFKIKYIPLNKAKDEPIFKNGKIYYKGRKIGWYDEDNK